MRAVKKSFKERGQQLSSYFSKENVKNLILVIKPFIKPFLIVFAIYCFAMLAIWRSGVSFIDDNGRAIAGYAWMSDFNRYSSSLLSYLTQVNFTLTDISPLSQIIAMAFLSIASVIVTYLFCNNEIKYLPLVLSTFIGLCPFILECWLYKFDSPGMALSVMISVIPFLFWTHSKKFSWKKWLPFGIVSLICLMIMWTSYQAASGIYLVMVLGLALKDFLDKVKIKEILQKSIFYFVIYLISAAIFKFALPSPTGYRDSTPFALSEMARGIYTNIKNLAKALLNCSSIEWKYLVVAFAISFFIGMIIFSKRKKWLRVSDAVISSLVMMISVPVSFGAYLVLQNAPTNARSILGVGVILAIAAILLTRKANNIWLKCLAIPSLVLLYSFIVYNFSLGNALADQERYTLYRTETLLTDLSHLYPTKESVAKMTLQVQGSAGLSTVAQHVNSQYPVTSVIITEQQSLSDYAWGTRKLRYYYNRPQDFAGVWSGRWDCQGWRTQTDTYYHTIKVNDTGDKICVVLK